MNIRNSVLLSTVLACGAATIAMAAADPAQHSPVRAHSHSEGAPLDGPFLHAIHQLNLTAEQQTTIHGFLETAKRNNRSIAASQSSVDALANPGDPYYATAVAAAKSAAVNRIQKRSDLDIQIYGALTPDQQAKLPQVLADMKTQRAQHHAEMQQKHGQAPAAN